MWREDLPHVLGNNRGRSTVRFQGIYLHVYALLIRIIELTYIFKFPEKKLNEEGEAIWVVRQTGVYQQHDLVTQKHIWLMIFPNREMDSTQNIVQNHAEHPLQPHLALISSRIHHWRWYLSDFDKRHQKAVSNRGHTR
jgi:hypothetical protein